MVPPHPGGFSRPAAAVGRSLPGCGEAELMLNLAGMAKRLKWLRYCIAVLICSVQVEYTLRLRNSARLPYISYMLAAVVEHLFEQSELCGAIANKRMYEIRKRSVFSKQIVYSP